MKAWAVLCLTTLALFMGSTLYAEKLDISNSSVSWVAMGNPGFLQIEGKSPKPLKGEIKKVGEKIDAEFDCDLTSFRSGIAMRDKHMHDKYFESAKFPVATIKIKAFEPKPGIDQIFDGDLTIKGVTKPVTGRVLILKNPNGLDIEARFNVNLTDYPIGVPSYLGVTVAKDVEVKVKLETLKI